MHEVLKYKTIDTETTHKNIVNISNFSFNLLAVEGFRSG